MIYLFEIFILLSVLLGTGLQCYSVPYWDKFEHLFSAAMLAGLGFAIFTALTPAKRLAATSPLLMALFASRLEQPSGYCGSFMSLHLMDYWV
ncbi:hypothetical protein N577_007745 [Lacticaseibacillus rhamnosus 2166]|nr:hypothetical protein N577_007745 [Lacticaseibacillus rhamnosus 2166]